MWMNLRLPTWLTWLVGFFSLRQTSSMIGFLFRLHLNRIRPVYIYRQHKILAHHMRLHISSEYCTKWYDQWIFRKLLSNEWFGMRPHRRRRSCFVGALTQVGFGNRSCTWLPYDWWFYMYATKSKSAPHRSIGALRLQQHALENENSKKLSKDSVQKFQLTVVQMQKVTPTGKIGRYDRSFRHRWPKIRYYFSIFSF